MVTNGAESPLVEDDESSVGEAFVRNSLVAVAVAVAVLAALKKEERATLGLTKANDFLEISEASSIKRSAEARGRRNMTNALVDDIDVVVNQPTSTADHVNYIATFFFLM